MNSGKHLSNAILAIAIRRRFGTLAHDQGFLKLQKCLKQVSGISSPSRGPRTLASIAEGVTVPNVQVKAVAAAVGAEAAHADASHRVSDRAPFRSPAHVVSAYAFGITVTCIRSLT